MDKSLPERMVERADKDNLPADHPLRIRAKELEGAIEVYPRHHIPKSSMALHFFIGAWARARKVWCEYTGEELI